MNSPIYLQSLIHITKKLVNRCKQPLLHNPWQGSWGEEGKTKMILIHKKNKKWIRFINDEEKKKSEEENCFAKIEYVKV